MSLEDLRHMGLLRDEADPDADAPPAPPAAPAMLVAAFVSIAGCVAMALGDGGALTWIGVLGFLAGLFALIAVNLRGVRGGR